MNNIERAQKARNVTLISIIVTAFLGIIKVIGGVFFHSHALIADGVHSFSDLLTDVLILFASKYGNLAADDDHPYGHQRIETAATLLLSLLLIVAGSSIAWDALDELLHAATTQPQWPSLPIIIVSILANELLFHYTHYIGKQIRSPLIMANAWHHRSDAASSIVVFIGLLGSLAGIAYLDTFAAVIVGIMIIKMGGDYAWNSVKELVDTAVSSELLAEIRQIIQSVNGVEKIHQLRSRMMSGDVYIDVHVMVNPKISVSEGHYIAQNVHQVLLDKIECVKDVTVHVDPEDDEMCAPSFNLPNRAVINDLIEKEVKIDFPQIMYWNLHYLNGKINIDIVCKEPFNQWDALHQRIMMALQLRTDINKIRLFSLQRSCSDSA